MLAHKAYNFHPFVSLSRVLYLFNFFCVRKSLGKVIKTRTKCKIQRIANTKWWKKYIHIYINVVLNNIVNVYINVIAAFAACFFKFAQKVHRKRAVSGSLNNGAIFGSNTIWKVHFIENLIRRDGKRILDLLEEMAKGTQNADNSCTDFHQMQCVIRLSRSSIDVINAKCPLKSLKLPCVSKYSLARI